MASKVALAVLPRMAVQPLADVQQSSIPRIITTSFLGMGAETMPVPLGAERRATQSHSALAWNCVRLAKLVPSQEQQEAWSR